MPRPRLSTSVVTLFAVLAATAPAAAHLPRAGVPDALDPFAEGGWRAETAIAGPAVTDLERLKEASLELRRFTAPPLSARDAEELGRGPNGGTGVAHRAGARLVENPPHALPSGVHHSIGKPAIEPTIGVMSDGTLFFNGVVSIGNGDGQYTLVMRSKDEGRTWETLDLLAEGVHNDTTTADPLIYVDPATDRIFNFDYTPPCSFISHSDDKGETWPFGVSCFQFDHQTLFAGPPPEGGAKPSGYPNVVYYCAIDGGPSVSPPGMTGCSKSLDGGVTWMRTLTPAYVTDFSRPGGSLGIPGFCYGATGHGRVGPDGTIYLPRGFCDQPFLAISRDEGDSWERVQVSDLGMHVGGADAIGIEEHEARVAIDPSGVVYYFWIARDHLPYLAVSRDGGKSFGKPLMVAPPGMNEAFSPSIAAGADGRVVFSYIGTHNSPGGPFCVTTTPNDCLTEDGSPGKGPAEYAKTTWSGYIGMTVDATAADPVFYTAPVNDPRDPIHRGYCGGIACGATHEFHDVVIGPDGTPWASFSDGCFADESEPCPGGGIGIAGRLVAGPPLVGTLREQKPVVVAPPRPASCTERQVLTIRVKRPKRGRLRSVTATVGGKRARVRRRGTGYVVRVDLRRFAAGRKVQVRITTRTTTGRRFTTRRTYRVCG